MSAAGCTSPDDAPVEPADTDEGTPTAPAPATPTRPTPSPRPSPTPTSPTPTSPTSPASGPADTSAPRPPEVVLIEGDSSALLAIGAPEPVGGAAVEVAFAVLDLPRASPQNGTLVVTWTSTTPLDASLTVYLVDTDNNIIGSGSGPSPLTVEIAGASFGLATELRASAVPTAPGVAIMSATHYALSVTYA